MGYRILGGIWEFCKYVFVPQRRPKDYYNQTMTQDERCLRY